MRSVLVLLLVLSSTSVLSQDEVQEVILGGNAIVDGKALEADLADLNLQEGLARDALVAKRKFPSRIPLRLPPEHVQTHQFLRMRVELPPDPTESFFVYYWKLQGLSDDKIKYEEFNRLHFQPIVKKLQSYAYARIPNDATESQRDKLRAAAVVDIRRAEREFRASYPNLPARFKGKSLEDVLIFGPGSLFEKVMRKHGLMD